MTYTLFGEIASSVFHLSFARHPQTSVAREQCRPPLFNTGKACKWNNFDSLQGAKPIKKQTCLTDVFGRRCWSGKGFNPYVFFLLLLVWTLQPSFETRYGHVHMGHTQFYACVTILCDFQLLDEELWYHTLDIGEQVSVYLAFLNSTLNPLLYVFSGQYFRRKVSAIYRRTRHPRRGSDMTTYQRSVVSTYINRAEQIKTVVIFIPKGQMWLLMTSYPQLPLLFMDNQWRNIQDMSYFLRLNTITMLLDS